MKMLAGLLMVMALAQLETATVIGAAGWNGDRP
jgi:hypothetical protein